MMALAKVHTSKGSTNGKRRMKRAIVKVAATKRRRIQGKAETSARTWAAA
jgi:hypothetical protein